MLHLSLELFNIYMAIQDKNDALHKIESRNAFLRRRTNNKHKEEIEQLRIRHEEETKNLLIEQDRANFRLADNIAREISEFRKHKKNKLASKKRREQAYE